MIGARPAGAAEWLLVVNGAALALVVGVDGPAPWPSIRGLTALIATITLLWARRAHGPRRTNPGLLVAGLLGLIAGGGIGAPHAVQAGVSIEAVSGVVALATGLLLIGLATMTRLRRVGWFGRVLTAPMVLAIAVLLVAPLTLAVFVTNVPPLTLGDETPADRGLPYERASFRASDGVRLEAWYVPSTNGAAVVLLGGATNTRSDELDHAEVLARHGYGVLLVDARGHGESDGDAMLWGWFGETDVRASVDYLERRADVVNGIGAVGMSMGAEEAIGAAGGDPRIAAVVAEGATARGSRDEGDRAVGVGGLLTRYVDWTTSHAADLMTDARSPQTLRSAIAGAAPRPIMLIAAGTQPAEIDAARAFEAIAPEHVELWIAPGAGHTAAYDVHPAEWEERVVAFLDRALDVA